jgi:hypothetical protein
MMTSSVLGSGCCPQRLSPVLAELSSADLLVYSLQTKCNACATPLPACNFLTALAGPGGNVYVFHLYWRLLGVHQRDARTEPEACEGDGMRVGIYLPQIGPDASQTRVVETAHAAVAPGATEVTALLQLAAGDRAVFTNPISSCQERLK